MNNSKPPEASKREDEVDFIGNMPDHILLLILSRLLSTEEVIRTSILSTRWRYLWTSIPSLHINCYRGQPCNFEKHKFEEFVDRVLVKVSEDLDNFHLFCGYYCSMSMVEQWIYVAVARNVKQVDLMFFLKEEIGDIELPHCLVTCGSLKELRLTLWQRGLRLPNIMGFPALRVLNLTWVNLLEDDELVKHFFQSCPLLEDLTLHACSISKLNLLCISCQKLKKFRITGTGELCGGIKICCPRLVFMELTGDIAYNYVFECLDSLKEAEITPRRNTKSKMFSGISHVESLLIDLHFFSQCINAASDPGLPNMKTLTLTTTIDAFTFDKFIRILKYYPKLESLKLITKRTFSNPLEASELYEGDLRRILSPDVNRVELFEFKGEKPKIVPNWLGKIFWEMVFIWSNKGEYSH